jgi:hypothetical protein
LTWIDSIIVLSTYNAKSSNEFHHEKSEFFVYYSEFSIGHRFPLPLSDFFVVGQGTFTVIKIFPGEKAGRLTQPDDIGFLQGGIGIDLAVIDKHTMSAFHVFGMKGIVIFIKSDLQVFAGYVLVQDLKG